MPRLPGRTLVAAIRGLPRLYPSALTLWLLAPGVAGCALSTTQGEGLPGAAPDLLGCVGSACPCQKNGDCIGEARICDPATRRCVACLSSSDCPSGRVCYGSACANSCSGSACGVCKVCEHDAGVCLGCLSDSDCSGCGGVRCDTSLHTLSLIHI